MMSRKNAIYSTLVVLCIFASFSFHAEAKSIIKHKLSRLKEAKLKLFSKADGYDEEEKFEKKKEKEILVRPRYKRERTPKPKIEIDTKSNGIHVHPKKISLHVDVKSTNTASYTECTDIPPDDIYTCEEQKHFGKCDAEFMIGFCHRSCGRPPCPSLDPVDSSSAETKQGSKSKGIHENGYRCYGSRCLPRHVTRCTTVTEAIEGSSQLSFLETVLEITGLKEKLDDPFLEITFLAPTDAAFEDLIEDLQITDKELLDYPDLLNEILEVHMLAEPLAIEDLQDGDILETMNDDSDLEISYQDRLFVVPDYGLPGEVLATDLAACRSVIHVIDTVLIPERSILHALELSDAIIADYEARSMSTSSTRSKHVYQGILR